MAKGGVGGTGGARGGRGGGRPRGRTVAAGALLAFLAVATGVVTRRTLGIREAARLAELDRRRVELEARRVQLERDIRDASSRARLQPVAERDLGMRIPADSQVVLLSAPRRAP